MLVNPINFSPATKRVIGRKILGFTEQYALNFPDMPLWIAATAGCGAGRCLLSKQTIGCAKRSGSV